jgi:poly-beta-1,6-N-acetyl-D-glucosamine biosynthesis protein PgaD
LNAHGLPPVPAPWPPLRVVRIGWFTRLRDVLLTVLAWVTLAWILRGLVYLVFDFLRAPIFELTTALPPNVEKLWDRLGILAVLSAMLAASLLLWAVRERSRLGATEQFPAPRPLTIAEQAAAFGLDGAEVTLARSFKVTNVLFQEDGSIAAFDDAEAAGRELGTGASL